MGRTKLIRAAGSGRAQTSYEAFTATFPKCGGKYPPRIQEAPRLMGFLGVGAQPDPGRFTRPDPWSLRAAPHPPALLGDLPGKHRCPQHQLVSADPPLPAAAPLGRCFRSTGLSSPVTSRVSKPTPLLRVFCLFLSPLTLHSLQTLSRRLRGFQVSLVGPPPHNIFKWGFSPLTISHET